MIPPVIHYGIFGGWKLTDTERRCIESWRRVLSGYELRLWNDSNGPVKSRFFKTACEKKPVNAANYIRYWAVFKYGGIYLDNDVEVLRPFDRNFRAFVGFQRDDTSDDCINTAVMGAVQHHPFVRDCLDRLDNDNGQTWPIWPGCGMPTEELHARGLRGLNVEQMVGNPLETPSSEIMVYAKDRFHPWRWDEEPDMSRVTNKTFAIHHWGKTWVRK